MFDFSLDKSTDDAQFDSVVKWDMLILGAGPGGLNAALYAARKGMKVGVITDELGGQLHNTTTIDNYLGFPNIQGHELSDKLVDHVQNHDVPIMKSTRLKSIQHLDPDFEVTTENNRSFKAKTVLLSMGGTPRKLGVTGEKTFANKGVSYCAICDAPFYEGKDVIIAGGGNAAAEAVIDMAHWARRVTVVHRSEWRADKVLLDKLKTIENLEIRLQTQINEVYGDDIIKGVKAYDKQKDEVIDIPTQGLLIEIGTVPNTHFVADMVTTNDKGEVLVDDMQMTNLPGLYAVGDVVAQPFKQIVISAGEGAKAALAANQYLNKNYKENE